MFEWHQMEVTIDRRDEFEARCTYADCGWAYSYVYGSGPVISCNEELAEFDFEVEHAEDAETDCAV